MQRCDSGLDRIRFPPTNAPMSPGRIEKLRPSTSAPGRLALHHPSSDREGFVQPARPEHGGVFSCVLPLPAVSSSRRRARAEPRRRLARTIRYHSDSAVELSSDLAGRRGFCTAPPIVASPRAALSSEFRQPAQQRARVMYGAADANIGSTSRTRRFCAITSTTLLVVATARITPVPCLSSSRATALVRCSRAGIRQYSAPV